MFYFLGVPKFGAINGASVGQVFKYKNLVFTRLLNKYTKILGLWVFFVLWLQ